MMYACKCVDGGGGGGDDNVLIRVALLLTFRNVFKFE